MRIQRKTISMNHKKIKGKRNVLLIRTLTCPYFNEHFDYHQKDIDKLIQVKFQCALVDKFFYVYQDFIRKETEIQVYQDLEYISLPNYQLLLGAKISQVEGEHMIKFYSAEEIIQTTFETQCLESTSYRQLFHTIKWLRNLQNPNIGFRLQQGQLLRLGTAQYKVITAEQIKIGTKQARFIKPRASIPYQAVCKYCESRFSSSYSDFLCSPCKCKQENQFVHFNCLAKWTQIKSIISQQEGCLVNYNIKNHQCESCKQEYPNIILKNGTKYSVFELPQYKNPLILENINQKGMITVLQKAPQGGITIGRGVACQVRSLQQGVSRQHSLIDKINGQWKIFDNNSKQGTLVYQSQLQLKLEHKPITMQVGHTVIHFRACYQE